MIFFYGIHLKDDKPLFLSLTSIYGIGRSLSLLILKTLNINPNILTKNLTSNDYQRLKNYLDSKKYLIEGDLKKQLYLNVQRLLNINCYRGSRYLKGLPVNGQRTRTNARTSKKLKLNIKK